MSIQTRELLYGLLKVYIGLNMVVVIKSSEV
jgi:hypothetical protein